VWVVLALAAAIIIVPYTINLAVWATGR